jgi:dienelactone hydrolase
MNLTKYGFNKSIITALTLSTLGLFLYGLDSDLINFFLPIRFFVLTLLTGSAVILALRLVLGLRTPAATRLSLSLMVTFALAALMIYVQEFKAYRELELTFENAGEQLSGTLYLPTEKDNYPAVVFAQGSIRAPRRLYHSWANSLVRNGIAVFSFDKRGTGKSGGNYESENNGSTENLKLLGSDVAAAVSRISRHPEVDPSKTGIVGFSMGGWMAPIAAQNNADVKFMVLVSGPVVSVGEEGYYSDLTGEIHGEGSGLSMAEIEKLTMDRPPSEFDPRSILQELPIPALWLFGGVDSSIPVKKSVKVLEQLKESHGRAYEYRVYPDGEHLGFVMNWPFDLAPNLMNDLVDWIKITTK